MAMEVVLRVPGCAPADQMAEFLGRVEAAGFDGVGVTDSQLLMRDVYVNLALAAQRTSHIPLYTAVTNPVTRHVSVLASAIQTVEELAPGRLRIMIGSGYSAVMTIGQRAATLRQMRETVLVLRKLLSGESVSINGFEAHLPYASDRHIPLIIAATGPRTLELAGEVADGALLLVGIHPKMIEAARRRVEHGARKAGRDPSSMEMLIAGRVYVDKTTESAVDMARPICAQWVVEPFHAQWLREAGIDVPEVNLPPELAALYPDIPHAENWEEARRATAFLTDEKVAEIGDVLGFFGTPEDCLKKIRKLEEYGVTRLYAMTVESNDLPERTLQGFRDVILPGLKG